MVPYDGVRGSIIENFNELGVKVHHFSGGCTGLCQTIYIGNKYHVILKQKLPNGLSWHKLKWHLKFSRILGIICHKTGLKWRNDLFLSSEISITTQQPLVFLNSLLPSSSSSLLFLFVFALDLLAGPTNWSVSDLNFTVSDALPITFVQQYPFFYLFSLPHIRIILRRSLHNLKKNTIIVYWMLNQVARSESNLALGETIMSPGTS